MTNHSTFEVRRLLSKALYSEAEKVCDILIQTNSDNSFIWPLYFQSLYQQRKFQKIVELFEQNQLNSDHLLSIYVNALRYTGQPLLAINTLKEALEETKENVYFYNQLGLIYKELAQVQNAIQSFQLVIKAKPDFYEAYWNLVGLTKRLTKDQVTFLEESLYNDNLSPQNVCFIHYSLYLHFENQAQLTQAFKHLLLGAKAKRSHLSYNHKSQLEEYSRIKEHINPAIIHQLSNAALTRKNSFIKKRAKPIFIFGMPRSGSTLVEQIVSSHPDVSCRDESQNLMLATESVLKESGIEKSFPECISDLNPSNIETIREHYFSLSNAPTDKKFFTDKTLLNFKALGFISAIFPDAKLIHCYRDPMDNMFSCFKQLFDGELEFTYDLNELSDIFLAYEKLMAHWKSISQIEFYSLNYTSLVEEKDSEIKNLLNYLGLKFSQNCIDFYNNDRPVHTLSSIQVKQPLHSSSTGQWKKYENELAEINFKLTN